MYSCIGLSGKPRMTFTFWAWKEDAEGYSEYQFNDGTTKQIIKQGSELVIPQPESTDTRVFGGWYEGQNTEAGLVLAEQPYDFDNIVIENNAQVELYAGYKEYANVFFHDQYDPQSESFPITYTRRAELTGEAGEKTALVRIDDLSASYASDDDTQMAFYGWSYTPVTTPGVYEDDSHTTYVITGSEGEEPGIIRISGETHLYPIYREIRRLSYYTAPSGSGATYVPSAAYFSDDGPTKLAEPVWEGYTFNGWYTGMLDADGTVIYGSVMIADSTGTLVPNVEDGGVYYSMGKLLMRQNATLYAKWSDRTVPYKVIFSKQKTEGEGYDFVACEVRTAAPDSTVSVTDADKQLIIL